MIRYDFGLHVTTGGRRIRQLCRRPGVAYRAGQERQPLLTPGLSGP